ncbi:MAG: helix-turn-helix domain-containing protein [Candidatus Hydrogenedentota bacterium]
MCHLEVQPGLIEAYVSGSSLYKVTIQIKKQKPDSWKAIKDKCAGQIGSMLELLQGKLSKQVMAIVADREEGLFPKPREITLACSCPDGARMCKHVAAVLYGVGNRLDDCPQLLFLLRGVDAEALIASEMALPDTAAPVDGEALMDDQLSDIFGVDVDTETPAADGAHLPPKSGNDTVSPRRKRRARKGPAPGKSSKKTAESAVAHEKVKAPTKIRPTGKSVARLRKKLKMNTREFADALGVSPATVQRWEDTSGRLNLHARCQNALAHLHQESNRR